MVTWQEEEEYETKGGRRRTWDDDFVLKRQFSALVPAFDPRPGRTNVQQTTDLEIPTPGTSLFIVRFSALFFFIFLLQVTLISTIAELYLPFLSFFFVFVCFKLRMLYCSVMYYKIHNVKIDTDCKKEHFPFYVLTV